MDVCWPPNTAQDVPWPSEAKNKVLEKCNSSISNRFIYAFYAHSTVNSLCKYVFLEASF